MKLGDGHFLDIGVAGQCCFDFLRRYAIAHRIHQVVGAAVVPHVSIGIEAGEVATNEPLSAINFCLLIRPPPVAEHEPWIGAVNGKQPGLARR